MNEKSASQLKQSDYLHALEEEETEFYEAIDPAQPSTSNAYRNEKFQYAHIPQHLTPPIAQHKSRLRALRQTSDAITEAAKKNGMQTVDRSGSRYVVPITMQAHPTQLNDYILPEKDDILSQNSPFPYCIHCHSIFKTWRGFEYHVLQIHLKYRPFRCYHCTKESFYTEEEGRFHSSTSHPNEEITLFKDFDVVKESAAEQAFKQVFMMCRDGPFVTRQRIYEWEQQATREIMKFHFLKFKRPIVVTKKLPTVSREIQTELTSLRMMIPQILEEQQQQLHHAPPIFQRLTMAGYHISTPLLSVGGRPRSTATQRDEDPRDREKRVAALMHAVTTSHNQ
ncbi:hypothetical protein L5515_005321 [Caenorhabditis briggsae]|uniref:C2H2-type domain-containing protein n=1 Tax=Caenorhabditis briggsae TaxID=6238 RepID=A0AAE9ESC5_CAEBR|nr:hypothetical protein L5515_005321 [Caenorhabditis briggsae]